MPFWDKKKTNDPPRKRGQSAADARFSARLKAVKRLSEETEPPCMSLNSLDQEGLEALERQLKEILNIVAEHKRDVQEEVRRDPLLLQAIPRFPYLLDRYAEDAEFCLGFVIQHLEARFPPWTDDSTD